MLPIRPVRKLNSYEEHLDFYRYSLIAQARRAHSASAHPRRKAPSFPYGKEADLEAAERFALALVKVLASAATLKGIAEQLADPAGSRALNRRAIHSSHPDAASVQAEPGAPTGTYALEIRRLATPQISCTAYFAPEAPTTVKHGINKLLLFSRHENKELEYLAGEGTTHKAALIWLKNSIHTATSRVRASMEKDTATGRIRLVLRSSASGAEEAFYLQDMEGNMASAMGLLVKDQPASDAQYRLNGGDWQFTPDNRVQAAEEGLHMELLQITDGPVAVTVAPDWPHIRQILRELGAAADSLEERLVQSAEFMNPRFLRKMGQIKESFPLEEELLATEQLTDLTNALSGEQGPVPRLLALIADMESVPAEELLNRDNSRYKRYANYLASREWYSQLPGQGLLLNRFW